MVPKRSRLTNNDTTSRQVYSQGNMSVHVAYFLTKRSVVCGGEHREFRIVKSLIILLAFAKVATLFEIALPIAKTLIHHLRSVPGYWVWGLIFAAIPLHANVTASRHVTHFTFLESQQRKPELLKKTGCDWTVKGL
ncbi:hypothetical protein P3342_000374 [Pyrenophora teres f. teres]|nr:hypothetical protein P3342_000374 [Pyrenophora teres f. teres]